MKAQFLVVMVMLIGLSVSGQPPHHHEGQGKEDRKERREKIEAMKVEYITTQLALTPEEAQKFWPVYNEFSTKLRELEQGRRKAMKAGRDQEELSDSQVNEIIQQMFDSEQQILDLRREYDQRFKKVLSVQKVGKLYKAEQSFRHELLKRMKEGGRPPQ